MAYQFNGIAINIECCPSLKEHSPQWQFYNSSRQLGENRLVLTEPDVYVANMCAQDNINKPYKGCRLNYSALVSCMVSLRDILQNPLYHGYSILAPRFGSGIASGNQDVIEKLIYEIWGNLNVTIIDYV